MATVYRALDTRLDRILALKVMHPSLASDAGFVERFIREAKSSKRRLAHPNVVQVFDQGTDGGYVYLAMEYIAGCTLRDVLRERGALQARAALDILEPVLADAGRRPPGGVRAPRHEAGERADRGRRPGQGRRLRPGPLGGHGHQHLGHRAGHGVVPGPGADGARHRRPPGRRVRLRHPAVRDADRREAARRRLPRDRPLQAPPRRRAAALRGGARSGARAGLPGGGGDRACPGGPPGRRGGAVRADPRGARPAHRRAARRDAPRRPCRPRSTTTPTTAPASSRARSPCRVPSP
ncbi:Serine/threonine-protein kinase PknD [Streptomyces glaucescens]